MLTDPEQAADFVKRTQLDALAIAIGTSHGAYKFTRKPTGDILAIDRVKEINAPAQHPPGDAWAPACRKTCWPSSTSTAAR
jgi:fructose/tagatose bisphosphate aldolase